MLPASMESAMGSPNPGLFPQGADTDFLMGKSQVCPQKNNLKKTLPFKWLSRSISTHFPFLREKKKEPNRLHYGTMGK